MALKAKSAKASQTYQTIPVRDLSGGVDLRTSPTLMDPSRARLLVNWSIASQGELSVRSGYAQFSTTSLGSGRIQGGMRCYLQTYTPSVNSTAFTLVAYGGGVYVATDSGGWLSTTPGLSGLSSGGDVFFAHDRDLAAVFDSTTTIRKSTNGSSWTNMGIAPGTVASSASSVAGGSLSASEFEFSYAYKDRDLAHQSNGSTALSTRTLGATGAISLQVPNSTDAQVDAIVIYARNKTATETVRRKATSGGISTAASSTLVVTSSNWLSNDEEPSDHNVPPILSFGVVWKNRWWARDASVTNRIRFTQLFQPQSWPSLFYIDIPFERGDKIEALVPLGDTLLVLGTTKIFVIFGQTSLDFEVRPTLASQEGAFGPNAVVVVEDGLMHAGASGIWAFDGVSDRLLTQDLEDGWNDLVDNSVPASLARVSLVYHMPAKEVRNAVPRRYPSGAQGEWTLNLLRTRGQNNVPAWESTDRPIVGYISWNGPETQQGNRNRLFSWASTGGVLWEEATGQSANSSNLTAEYEGPGLTLGTHMARWIDCRGEYEPRNGSFSLEPVVDGVSQGSQNITMAAPGAVYGTAEYGISAYGGSGRKQFHIVLPLASEGRTMVMKSVYTGTEKFRWFAYEPGVVPEGASRDFSE